MSDAVPVKLRDLGARDGWILDSRIYIEGGAEVAPLLVEPLMTSILCSSQLHGFMCSKEITQEIRSGGRREIFHELCGWG